MCIYYGLFLKDRAPIPNIQIYLYPHTILALNVVVYSKSLSSPIACVNMCVCVFPLCLTVVEIVGLQSLLDGTCILRNMDIYNCFCLSLEGDKNPASTASFGCRNVSIKTVSH